MSENETRPPVAAADSALAPTPSIPVASDNAAGKKNTSVFNLVSILAVALCLGGLFMVFGPGLKGPSVSYPSVVVIDTMAIIESYTAGMQKRGVRPNDIARDSEAFAKQLREVVSAYGKHSLVTNRYNAMAWPDGSADAAGYPRGARRHGR